MVWSDESSNKKCRFKGKKRIGDLFMAHLVYLEAHERY